MLTPYQIEAANSRRNGMDRLIALATAARTRFGTRLERDLIESLANALGCDPEDFAGIVAEAREEDERDDEAAFLDGCDYRASIAADYRMAVGV